MWRVVVKCFPVTLVFFAAQVAVLVGSRMTYPNEYPDPFAPYEAMMPGQEITVEDVPCDFIIRREYDETTSCETYPKNEVFNSVTSSVSGSGFVQTVFSFNHVLVGDIIRHWGRPDSVERLGPNFVVSWGEHGLNGVIIPVRKVGQLSYMTSVATFTLIDHTPYS